MRSGVTRSRPAPNKAPTSEAIDQSDEGAIEWRQLPAIIKRGKKISRRQRDEIAHRRNHRRQTDRQQRRIGHERRATNERGDNAADNASDDEK